MSHYKTFPDLGDAIKDIRTRLQAQEISPIDTGWVNLVMPTGWVGTATPQFRKIGIMVYFRGWATNQTGGAVSYASPVGSIPSGIAPLFTRYIAGVTNVPSATPSVGAWTVGGDGSFLFDIATNAGSIQSLEFSYARD